MKFLIVSNAPIIKKQTGTFAYSPYIKEMKIWANYADEVAFCCPVWKDENGLLVSEIPFQFYKNFRLSDFDVKSFKTVLKGLIQIPFNFLVLFKAMFWADHIHLRCPGNVGLLASIVQIFFPWKKKTAKYAGNWDPKSKQPWSYRLQRWILSSMFLTKNMQVLVYGEWPKSTKNIKPFFTASYSESTILPLQTKSFDAIRFLFVGTLSPGKQPLYAVQLVEKLANKGYSVSLDLYGEGTERNSLEKYIEEKNLSAIMQLYGNKASDEIKNAYQNSHFLVLPSKSEGWPKVVAEAMFWGCVPIATPVSCVSSMLDSGKRGVLLTMDITTDVSEIESCLNSEENYNLTSKQGATWSRQFTLEFFESEVKQLLAGNIFS
ncbi:glycosyltransferase [Flavobacterium suncheonense]|uniref:Glycosyl transferase n=1 Tax=Flavobacterium suncheonense GH29-5 = DSM 17707 TaxID=1121899 RepID=A0A0A2MCQ6_9FLAO|nr:glycosyltransferase [Flavobacterium suncheonense]KGO89421.1 glycosyl transferase [Flavobacterium suncheonense GH29-5 = DSM 17707]